MVIRMMVMVHDNINHYDLLILIIIYIIRPRIIRNVLVYKNIRIMRYDMILYDMIYEYDILVYAYDIYYDNCWLKSKL